jgi:flagellar basal-body rod protein FlgB
MSLENLALFKAAGAKMKYLNTSQQVIAQNIANADTAGYTARELSEVSFDKVLSRVSGRSQLQITSTSGVHLGASNQVGSYDEDEQKSTYEVTPSGNAVNIEEQLVKSSRVQMDYSMMLNIMKKQVGMIKTALGAPQG